VEFVLGEQESVRDYWHGYFEGYFEG